MGQVAGQVAGEVAGEVTGEVTGEVVHLVAVISAGQRTRTELQAALGLRSQANFRERYLLPALATGLIERTIRDKPRSRLQRYRLTEKGRAWLAAHADKGNGETGKP
jgi:DNA-binding PadR family transcriptional regulator